MNLGKTYQRRNQNLLAHHIDKKILNNRISMHNTNLIMI